MMGETIQLKASDRTTLYVHCWQAEAPRAAVLLAHGMTEHGGRYDTLGQFLCQHGISLYCHDQRGHGQTAGMALRHLRKGVDWNMMINDLFTVKKKQIDAETHCPVFLMGHSMGSFLARRTVQLGPELFDGLILSGTGDGHGAAGKAMVTVAGAACLAIGAEHKSKWLHHMMFHNYNAGIAHAQTDYDWLTRDRAEVARYCQDPWCGGICSNGFYYELLKGIQLANDPFNIALMRKSMPVYLFSGDQDPVGNYGKGVQHVYQLFNDVGMQDVTLRLYADGRHEMLNELNRDTVMQELLQWIEQKVSLLADTEGGHR